MEINPGARKSAALVLINPKAGMKANVATNTAGRPEVEAALRHAGVAYRVLEPASAEESTRMARDAARDGVSLVIAAGGDGTVQTVAFALLGSQTAMGIMPLGSFNNVSRSLDIPRDLAAAAAIVAEGATTWINVGKVGEQRFLESAGIGFDAAIMPHSNALGEGNLRSASAALKVMFTFRRGSVYLTLDGQRMRARAFMVVVANAPYSLAGLSIAPTAKMDDHLFDIVVYERFRRIELIVSLVGLLFHRPFPMNKVRIYRAHRVLVAGRRAWPIQADSHLCGTTPATIELDEHLLRVVHGPYAAVANGGGAGKWWEPAGVATEALGGRAGRDKQNVQLASDIRDAS